MKWTVTPGYLFLLLFRENKTRKKGAANVKITVEFQNYGEIDSSALNGVAESFTSVHLWSISCYV